MHGDNEDDNNSDNLLSGDEDNSDMSDLSAKHNNQPRVKEDEMAME